MRNVIDFIIEVILFIFTVIVYIGQDIKRLINPPRRIRRKRRRVPDKIEPPYCTDPISEFALDYSLDDVFEIDDAEQREQRRKKHEQKEQWVKKPKMARNETHVTWNKKVKQWEVKKYGSNEVLASNKLKKEIVKLGRSISKECGSKFVIHNRDGKIAKKDSHG